MRKLQSHMSRLVRSRGSVLILVVSLLLMLAMMGTAYIATARVDRQLAKASEIKITLVNPLVDQVGEDVKQTLVDDIVVGGKIRPLGTTYKHYTHPQTSLYLGDRLPSVESSGRPFWRYVSNASGASTFTPILLGTSPSWNRNSEGLAPTSIKVVYRPGVDQCPAVFPALAPCDPTTGVFSAGTEFIAADADGDGIADSILYPVSGLSGDDGVTYYYAVRIIDNNSALNASLDGSRRFDLNFADASVDALGVAAAAPANLGVFSSHIGLREASNDVAYPAEWLAYRNNRRGNPATVAMLGNLQTPMSDSGATRSDFSYITQGDAQYHQLDRRLSNPGRANISGSPSARYRSGVGDAGYIAYRFGLVDPSLNSNPNMLAPAAPATIEQLLSHSYYIPAINWVNNKRDNQWTQYPANQIRYWFDWSFNQAQVDTTAFTASTPTDSDMVGGTVLASTTYRNIRAMTVMSNPVSNAMARHYVTQPPLPNWEKLYPGMPDYSSTNNTPRVSINTADFGTLWRGFWNVMCDSSTSNPSLDGSATQFTPSGGLASTGDMHLLRSALAAVNAIDLRDGDDYPTYQVISIGGTNVRVYGTELQPYIVEATVDTSGNGTVKLYNPNTKAVNYSGTDWQIVKQSGSSFTSLVTLSGSLGPGAASGSIALTGIANSNVYLIHKALDYNGTAAASINDWAPCDSVTFPATPAATRYYKRCYPLTTGTPWQSVWPGTFPASFSASSTGATVGTPFEIQVANENAAGPNKISAASNKFPFGGFARDGDILQVTFIGSYRVDAGGGAQWTAITGDAVVAKDSSGADDAVEQVGRFCPIYALDRALGVTDYDWAAKLFDYFTAINNQNDDYFPNVDPNPTHPAGYTKLTGKTAEGVANGTTGTANGGFEDTSASSEGKININTAPWQVLAALPLKPHTGADSTNVKGGGSADGYQDDIEYLANAIVSYRNTAGPFTSLFELNKIPNGTGTPTYASFQDATIVGATGNPAAADGDLASGATDDGVVGDFEARCLTLTRLSNLLTTRSDGFTVYVVVQGWKNAGTATPSLVSQARKAFLMDRTRVTPATGTRGVSAMQVNY